MMINAVYVHNFINETKKSAEKGEIKQAIRYWKLAAHELRRQYHLTKARQIHEHMQTIAFKIEIDQNFETHQGVNN